MTACRSLSLGIPYAQGTRCLSKECACVSPDDPESVRSCPFPARLAARSRLKSPRHRRLTAPTAPACVYIQVEAFVKFAVALFEAHMKIAKAATPSTTEEQARGFAAPARRGLSAWARPHHAPC